MPGCRRRVADIFAEQASAETIAGAVADQWKAESKAEGVATGIVEGKAGTLRDLLPRFARLKFGAELPDDLPDRLSTCDLQRLWLLETAVETCNSLDDWLDLLPADPNM